MAGFNIAQMFRNTPQVTVANAQQNPAPTPTGQPGSSLTPTPGAPNPTGAPTNQGQGDPNQGQVNSPLDAWSKVWETPKVDPNAPPEDPWSQPLFNTDPTKVREAAGKMDFLGQVPQELMQKAMGGNDPQAFMQVMQSVAQNVLATSMQLGAATTEQAGQRIGQRFTQSLPGRIKDVQLSQQQPTNPVLQHPAAQGMLNIARNQIKMQNPDFTPQQIQAEAEKYLTDFSGALSAPADQGKNTPNAGGEQNWNEWAFSGPTGS